MPRVHVYLPDDLYQFVKDHQLLASELLQEAIRSKVYQQDLREEMERRINESIGEIRQPSAEAWAQARALSSRMRGDGTAGAGG